MRPVGFSAQPELSRQLAVQPLSMRKSAVTGSMGSSISTSFKTGLVGTTAFKTKLKSRSCLNLIWFYITLLLMQVCPLAVILTQLIIHRANILMLQWANKDVLAMTIVLLLYGTADQLRVSSDKQLASAFTAVVDSRARQPVTHHALVCVHQCGWRPPETIKVSSSENVLLWLFACGFYLWTASYD